MKIQIKKKDKFKSEGDLLVLGVHVDEDEQKEFEEKYKDIFPHSFKKMAKSQSFSGELGQSVIFPAPVTLKYKYILIVGLGERNVDNHNIREAIGVVVRASRKLGVQKVVIELFNEDKNEIYNSETLFQIIESALLADYNFDRYKESEREEIEILIVVDKNIKNTDKILKHAQDLVDGVDSARDLVNTPAYEMQPIDLLTEAKDIAKKSFGRIKVKYLNLEQCEKQSMGAFLAVARSSNADPKFIHLTYKPNKKAKKKIVLVGKGVTFDSGGLSLKHSKSMETMKCDMAGAGTVLGVFNVLSELKPSVEVHGIIPATENLPLPGAVKPGDIVRASNGKTIEILNTDAEGRLTLADALVYAQKLKPDYLIDLATLTGACVVALGEEIGAVMSNDKDLSDLILSSAKQADEKMWELPLESRYSNLLKSSIADLRNISTSRYGGSLTAGLFLKEFIEDGQKWVHLDIAGPAFAKRSLSSYIATGGTGFGVRTLIKLIRNIK